MAAAVLIIGGCESGSRTVLSFPDVAPPLCSTDTAPMLVTGIPTAGDTTWFGRISSAVLLHGQRAAIADPVRSQITLIHFDGSATQVIGGAGSGPGEYLSLRKLLLWSPDTILAHDSRGRRLTLLSAASGEPVGTYVVPQQLSFSASPVSRSGSSSILYIDPTSWSATSGTVHDSLRIGEYTIEGELVRSWATLPGKVLNVDLTDGYSVWSAPFSGSTFVGTSGSEIVVALLDADSVELRSADSIIRRIPIPLPRHPVTAELRRAFEDERRRGSTHVQVVERMLRRVEYPDSTPRVSGLKTDATGNIWVQSYSASPFDSVTVVSFDRTGNPTDRLLLPPQSSFLDADETHMLIRRKTEHDVEYLQVHSRRCEGSIS